MVIPAHYRKAESQDLRVSALHDVLQGVFPNCLSNLNLNTTKSTTTDKNLVPI